MITMLAPLHRPVSYVSIGGVEPSECVDQDVARVQGGGRKMSQGCTSIGGAGPSEWVDQGVGRKMSQICVSAGWET
jgi:hypothetical protein